MLVAVAPIYDLTGWLRTSGLEIVLFVIGSVLLSRLIRWVGERVTSRIDARSVGSEGLVRSEAAKHRHVLAQVTIWVAVVLTYSVAVVLVLQRLNVPISGLIAPAAAIGVAIGFGAQRLVQDVLAGVFIIAERQYGFGDLIRISPLGTEAGVSGTVEEVTLRVTRLRTLNGEVVIVGNGQIMQVTNMSREWARAVVDVPVPNTADVSALRETLRRVVAEAARDGQLGPLLLDQPAVLGVESMDLDTLHIRIVARTLPGKQFEVGRELRSRIAVALHSEGIRVTADLDTAEPTGVG